MSTEEKIAAITGRIVNLFDPEKIILFGSRGNGSAAPDSDVDLLIVMHHDGSPRKKAIEIGVELHDFDMPKDILVTTPDEFEWRKNISGTIEYPAAHEGKVLYARA